MKYEKSCFFIILVMFPLILSGCWDKAELEESGYVAAIGLDKGSEKNIRITFQITNPKTIPSGRAGGGGGNIPKSEIITVDAPSILTARDLITASTTRRVSLSHAKVVIVGEDFARDDKFFRYLEASLRDKEMRRVMTLIVSRESAEDFINANNPTLEDRMQKFYEFMSRRWKDTGYVPPRANLNRYMQRTEGGGSLFLAIYATTKKDNPKEGADEGAYLPGEIDKEGGNPAELIGGAVFRNGKMIGTLNGNEMRLVSMLREKPETKNMLVTFIDPIDNNYRIDAAIIREKKTKVNLDIGDDNPRIHVEVPITMDILGIPSFVNYAEDMDKQEILKNYLENYLAKISYKLIQKTQEEFKGDPFLWELCIRKKFFTFDEYEKYDWMQHYTHAKVDVKFDIKIRSFGKQLSPPKKPKNNEEQGEDL